MAQIAEELSVSIEQFFKTYVRKSSCIRRPVLDSGTGSCPFLGWEENGKAKCTIYSYRPQVCRDWQASLMKLECQEGLLNLKDGNNIVTPHDIYNSQVDIYKLYDSLKMH